MHRHLIVAAMLAVSSGYVIGSAASAALTVRTLGAASVATPRCTNAGLAMIPTLSGSTVSSVSVGGLPAACGGATLRVTVNDGTVAGSGSATVPVVGGSLVVTIASSPTLTTHVEIDAVLEGP